ncbi:13938_t:CDS:1, partial [Cetraspora pellucida]
ARLLSTWLKLLSSKTFWAIVERDTIESELYSKRNISVTDALSQTPLKTKG